MLFGVGFNLGVNVKNRLERPPLLFAYCVFCKLLFFRILSIGLSAK